MHREESGEVNVLPLIPENYDDTVSCDSQNAEELFNILSQLVKNQIKLLTQ